jgi:hypothetical protein
MPGSVNGGHAIASHGSARWQGGNKLPSGDEPESCTICGLFNYIVQDHPSDLLKSIR